MKGKAFRWFSSIAALGLVVAMLAGCTPKGSAATGDVIKSGKPRLAPPALEQAHLSELVTGNTRFALDLYHVLYDQSTNLFYSPYSISQALAMTYAGARGATAEEMAAALHFALAQEELHPAFNALDQALASRGEGAQKEGEPFRLHIANALWGQKDFDFQAAFLDLLAENYGAGLRVLDFQGAPDTSRQTINRWVEEQTEKKIVNLLPEGAIDGLTRLVLTNAIYFNAGWLYPFQENSTAAGAFHLLDGSTVDVPMMHLSEHLRYAEGQGYQVIELPYVGNEMSMVILLPAEGQFEALAQSLDAGRLATMLQDLQGTQVNLTLPKFKFEAKAELKDALSRLGMVQAFDANSADFSGMTGRRDLYIDEVYHKAYVAVDEKGTEAAAATAAVVQLGAAPLEPVEMVIDRPFLFLIRDMETDAILFLGQVVNPAA